MSTHNTSHSPLESTTSHNDSKQVETDEVESKIYVYRETDEQKKERWAALDEIIPSKVWKMFMMEMCNDLGNDVCTVEGTVDLFCLLPLRCKDCELSEFDEEYAATVVADAPEGMMYTYPNYTASCRTKITPTGYYVTMTMTLIQ
jgi:hypothetical protein